MRDLFSKEPDAIEAAVALLKFGVDLEQVKENASISSDGNSDEDDNPGDYEKEVVDWRKDYLKAFNHVFNSEYERECQTPQL
jgi:hypothetical protein